MDRASPNRNNENVTTTSEPWFNNVRIVDHEWIELRVTTSSGDQAYYLIPRRTFFEDIDNAAAA